jgi:hypothetical protein
MESFIGNNFFQNPFGGGMNPMGGGGGGVLERIQQQVTDNGQALQSLQGGIGGLPSGNLPTGGIGGASFKNPGDLPNPLDFNPPPSITDAATDIDAQLRTEYDELVASAKKRRDEGFMGRVVLPGENLSFEEFKKMQIKPGSPFDLLGGVMQSDIFNIVQPEQNPGMDYSQFTPTIGNLYDDTYTGPTVDNFTAIDQQIFNDGFRPGTTQLTNAGNRGYTGGGSPPVFNNGVNINQNQTSGMDQLFGRAFAGKPV